MFVNPFPFSNGAEDNEGGVTINVTAVDMQGFQGNPFVVTEDTNLKRELYDLQKMVDPGDPAKEREIWHMFPGVYTFTSDVYVNVPSDSVAYLVTPQSMLLAGVSVTSQLFKPGFKGLVTGQFTVNGGEVFLQPGQVVAELVMVKAETK